MKVKALQLGKAMSAALFVLLLTVAGMKNALAQIQVATLQHGDDISVFYGSTAFVEAHDAAETGDVITLSSGTFTQTNITKEIVLRGAGAAYDSTTLTLPTIIVGDVLLGRSNDSLSLYIEGISFSNNVQMCHLFNSNFIRCKFQNLNRENNYSLTFTNCKIGSGFASNSYNEIYINCWVSNFDRADEGIGVTFYNSLINYPSGFQHAVLNNCILDAGATLPNTVICYNCIACTSNEEVYNYAYAVNCIRFNSFDEIVDYVSDIEMGYYILKDDIASSFLGSDGTQVGIYGGSVPYSNIPSYMLRTQVNVPNRSNMDGTLNVEIEVIDEDQ